MGGRPVAVVFGGPPCQGFSLIGQRALDDPRNSLVREFVRLVGELNPSYFVFENVKGLTLGRHRSFLEEVIEAFDGIGYRVTLPWQVLNSASYGVPQYRERLFLIGAREDLPLPAYPDPITRPAGEASGGLPTGPSCRDALGDLPEAEDYSELLIGDSIETSAWKEASVFASGMRCLTEDSWGFSYRRIWNSSVLTASMRTKHTRVSRRRFAETEPGKVEPISRFYRLPAGGISNTLRAGTDSSRGAFTSPRPIHYERARCVTVREMARLHSFPDWFRFNETKWHGARQVGNAVPPMLARAVASRLVEALGVEATRPEIPIDLGDPDLLRMHMSRASAFWRVPNPIGRRDRKSGAKKRKQDDIEADRLSGSTAGDG